MMPKTVHPHRLLSLIAILLLAVPAAVRAEADILILNGRLLDGTGNPWVRADVAVTGGRIIAVGDLADMTAARTIDATGLHVAPGFIDTHSHAGGGLARESTSRAEPLLAQGVTTVLVNPDGGGVADLAGQREAFLEHGIGVNAGQMIGHGAIRRSVMGMAGRLATPEEIEQMQALVRAGMEEGAFAFSSGPFYAPGSYSDTAEMIALARVAAEYGTAHQSHIRDESDYTIGVVASVEEVIEISREAGLPGIVTHIKALGPGVWGYSEAIVRRIEMAREEGLEIWADQYPYIASATGLSSALVPRWAQEGGGSAFRSRLEDPETRLRIRAEMAENLARRGGADRIRFRGSGPLAGRTLAEVAEERGLEDVDAAMAILESSSPGIISFNMEERDVERFMRQPWTMTASDGSLPEFGQGTPHPRGYGSFPRRLGVYTRDRGVVDLAMAVRSMTHLPASVYRIEDRGIIREGAWADIVVFDLERLHDPATFDDPHQLAEGMVHVLVNGELAMDGGEFTGGLHGRILRRR